MTETPLQISILDNSGRLLNVVETISNSPVSVSNLSPGIYNISIHSSEFITSSRLIIWLVCFSYPSSYGVEGK